MKCTSVLFVHALLYWVDEVGSIWRRCLEFTYYASLSQRNGRWRSPCRVQGKLLSRLCAEGRAISEHYNSCCIWIEMFSLFFFLFFEWGVSAYARDDCFLLTGEDGRSYRRSRSIEFALFIFNSRDHESWGYRDHREILECRKWEHMCVRSKSATHLLRLNCPSCNLRRVTKSTVVDQGVYPSLAARLRLLSCVPKCTK